MPEILNVANWLLPILYLVLLIDYGSAFFLRTDRGPQPRPAGPPESPAHRRNAWLPAVVVVHLLFLVLLAVHLGRLVPVNNFEVLSAVAVSLAAVYWVVELAGKDRRAGVFVLLAAFLLQYTSSVFLPSADLHPSGPGLTSQGHWAGLHILPSLVAYTAFTIAAIFGVLHLLAQRDLKQHRFGLLFDRLPPMELLGKMTWYAILTGFAFMTLTIASGAMMAHDPSQRAAGGMDLKLLNKIVAGLVAWCIYAVAIIGRLAGKWALARVSRVTTYGFVVVVAMLVASIVLSK